MNIDKSRLVIDPPKNDGLSEDLLANDRYGYVMALASMVGLIDPSVGNHLVAYRSGTRVVDREPYRWLLVNGPDAIDEKGNLVDDHAVDLFEKLSEVTSEDDYSKITKNMSPGWDKKTRGTATEIVSDAFKKGELNVYSSPLENGNMRSWTNARNVSEVNILSYKGMCSIAFFGNHITSRQPHEKTGGTSCAARIIENLAIVKKGLSKPFSDASSNDRKRVLKGVNYLSSRSFAGEPFERAFRHGWVGYALANNKNGWAKFLLEKANVDPNAGYGQTSAMVAAIAKNRGDIVTLLASSFGASTNSVLPGWPVIKTAGQNIFKKMSSGIVPLAVFAARMSSPSALSALLSFGADPNQPSSEGNTPLHHASHIADEASIRLLLRHGANAAIENVHGVVPCELVPDSNSCDSVYDMLNKAYLQDKAMTSHDSSINNKKDKSEFSDVMDWMAEYGNKGTREKKKPYLSDVVRPTRSGDTPRGPQENSQSVKRKKRAKGGLSHVG